MLGPGEAGCFRQVAALYSDHYRQVTVQYSRTMGAFNSKAGSNYLQLVNEIMSNYWTLGYNKSHKSLLVSKHTHRS